MKFSCEKSLLQSAISTASRTAAVKSAIPALEGLLIEAMSDKISITGYDLKTGIKTSIPADIAETGNIVVNSRLFGEIIRKLADDVVNIDVDENLMVRISCGMSEFNIIGISAEDYPDLPSVDYQNAVFIAESTLKGMISQTIFAVSDNEARPIHTGALFEIDSDSLTMVAVDGYRLALRKESISSAETDIKSFVVPGTALSEVEKIAGDGDEVIKITVGSKHIMFVIGTTVLITRRLEGEFLNYRNTIPQTSKYEISADRRDIITAVDRVSLIISDRVRTPVRFTFGLNNLKVRTATPLGRANDECAVQGDGEELEIGFNSKYILDALKAAPADKIKINLSSGVSPCIIVPEDSGDKFLYMILPVRLKNEA